MGQESTYVLKGHSRCCERSDLERPGLGLRNSGRMYTLLSGLYKYVFQKDEYCILILGLDNAGKTTFLEQSKTRFNKHYKGMSLSKITTTVGLNIGTVDVGKARLMFWDLGGQEELQSLWDKYYAECHGVIYVIDSTDEERLSESKQAFEKMVTSEALEGVPILVLANKQDVEVSLVPRRCQRSPPTPIAGQRWSCVLGIHGLPQTLQACLTRVHRALLGWHPGTPAAALGSFPGRPTNLPSLAGQHSFVCAPLPSRHPPAPVCCQLGCGGGRKLWRRAAGAQDQSWKPRRAPQVPGRGLTQGVHCTNPAPRQHR
nr:ADP-ribosylation factor-related protein 1 isoform X1 [Loxodonta africana]